jgi:DNA-binding transcriptional regulator YiaG
MITAETYEFEGERFVKLTSELGGTMDVTPAEYRRLAGYVLRDYDHAIATLRESREDQRLSRRALAPRAGCSMSSLSYWETGTAWPLAPNLFALAAALGYDLALVPRSDA